MLTKIKKIIKRLISPYDKFSFLSSGLIRNNAKILDVGCGNNSVIEIKHAIPNCHYTGLDVTDHNLNQESKLLMDKYITTDPKTFSVAIKSFDSEFDLVISAHNIEHCEKQEEVLVNMLGAVNSEGLIYISFPTKNSVNFPSRIGTLNYFDDITHKGHPPDFDKIIGILKKNNFILLF